MARAAAPADPAPASSQARSAHAAATCKGCTESAAEPLLDPVPSLSTRTIARPCQRRGRATAHSRSTTAAADSPAMQCPRPSRLACTSPNENRDRTKAQGALPPNPARRARPHAPLSPFLSIVMHGGGPAVQVREGRGVRNHLIFLTWWPRHGANTQKSAVPKVRLATEHRLIFLSARPYIIEYIMFLKPINYLIFTAPY